MRKILPGLRHCLSGHHPGILMGRVKPIKEKGTDVSCKLIFQIISPCDLRSAKQCERSEYI
jgi:hypothetical protein